MAKITLTGFLATLLITVILLNSSAIASSSFVKDGERLDSSWACRGKSRKMYGGCWKHLVSFKGPVHAVSRREAVGTPPAPQHSQPPPIK